MSSGCGIEKSISVLKLGLTKFRTCCTGALVTYGPCIFFSVLKLEDRPGEVDLCKTDAKCLGQTKTYKIISWVREMERVDQDNHGSG